MSSTTGRRRGLRAVLVLGTAGLALSACGSVVSSGGSGSEPPVLHIGARSAPVAGSVGGPGQPDDPYPLGGTLPTGPSAAPVHRFGTAPVPAGTVLSLAGSLGLSGSVVRHAHGVALASRAGTLLVRDGGSWSYSRADDLCAGQRVDVDSADPQSVAMGCAISVPDGTLAKPPADPRPVADPVLAAAGLGGLPTQVVAYGDTSTVSVDPRLGGAVTVGLTTSVVVDAEGVRSAYGVLGQPVEGPEYPLISAAQALEVLRAMPRPEIAIACAIGATCPGVGPQKVTGAALGLSAAWDGAEQVLVPAWLFSLEGSTTPAVVIAVADRYLADHEPVAGSGGGSGSVGGSSGSAAPPAGSTPLPAPSASDLPLPVGDPPAYPVESYTVSSDGRTLTVRTTGPSCVRYTAGATERTGSVRVTIDGAYPDVPQMACPALAREVSLTVTLASALGTRTVVDARTGAVVPRQA